MALISRTNASLCTAVVLLATAPASQADLFTDSVYPVLRENCFDCHGPDKRKGGVADVHRPAIDASRGVDD